MYLYIVDVILFCWIVCLGLVLYFVCVELIFVGSIVSLHFFWRWYIFEDCGNCLFCTIIV